MPDPALPKAVLPPLRGARLLQEGATKAVEAARQAKMAEQPPTTRGFKFLPDPGIGGKNQKSLAKEDFGLNAELYGKLIKAAREAKVTILIRKTNKGSVIPLAKIGAVGKKLATKGKSSSAFFTNGNITFLGCLAKRVDNRYQEQLALIDILTVQAAGGVFPKYAFIPKLISINTGDWPVPMALKHVQFVARLAASLQDVPNSNGDKSVNAKRIWGAEITQSHGIEQEDANIYLLKKTTFAQASQIGLKRTIHRPPFLKPNNDECYQVYIRADLVEGLLDENKIPEELQRELSAFQGKRPAPTQAEISAYTEAYTAKLVSLQTAFDKHAPLLKDNAGNVVEINGYKYREVRVLAIATHNDPKIEEGAPKEKEKEYYEIVADYDMFMVAPSIEAFCTGGDENGLEGQLWPLGYDYSRFVPTFSANHGVASQFDLDARKAINAALANKAVQHGAEINNLFYVSDFFEPLIFISPHASGEATDLYFLTPKLFFEMQKDTNYVDPTTKLPSAFRSITISNETEPYLGGLIPQGSSIKVRRPSERINNMFPFLYNYMWELPKDEKKAAMWKFYFYSPYNSVVLSWSGIEISTAKELSVAESLLVSNIVDWLEQVHEVQCKREWVWQPHLESTQILYENYQRLFFTCIIQLQFHYLNTVGVLMILHRSGIVDAAHTTDEKIKTAKKVYFRVLELIKGFLEKIEKSFFSEICIQRRSKISRETDEEFGKKNDEAKSTYKKENQIQIAFLGSNLDWPVAQDQSKTNQIKLNALNDSLVKRGVPFQFMWAEKQTGNVVVSHFLSAFYAWKDDLDKICSPRDPNKPFAGTKILAQMGGAQIALADIQTTSH